MPKQVIPITGLDTVGVIKDSPPVSLPPNAFSDARNVRFKDGSVRKMEGEVNIFPNLFDVGDLTHGSGTSKRVLKYVAWWPNPNLISSQSGYYLVIVEEDVNGTIMDAAYLFQPGDTSTGTDFFSAARRKGQFTRDRLANWQHTFFQGGFTLIINNGLDAPHYITDLDGNVETARVRQFAVLPGWDSYKIRDDVIPTETFNEEVDLRTFDTGRVRTTFELNELIVDLTYSTAITLRDISDSNNPVDVSVNGLSIRFVNNGDPLMDGSPTTNVFASSTVGLTLNTDFPAGTTPTTRAITINANYDVGGGVTRTVTAMNGATLIVSDENIAIQLSAELLPNGTSLSARFISNNEASTRCGVIRSFGDFLVAGNLVEREAGTTNILRNLNGVVRTSDVAAPGQVPSNWNPFSTGVSTADEFVLTSTGVVQDMGELQGNFYIYSNTSISVMRQTGNANVPLQVTPITENYGCQTTEAVVEVDGKHLVIGSQDIYIFGGHPGSIQSVADTRVRRDFFQRLNPLHNQRMFTIRYAQRDEVWICYPTTASVQGECDEALIWNYRSNIWTIRDLNSVVAGDLGPVPGGGLPTSTANVSGTSGDNSQQVEGMAARHSAEFGSAFQVATPTVSAQPSIHQFSVPNIPTFTSSLTGFLFVFNDEAFDTGPIAGIDNVTLDSESMRFRIDLTPGRVGETNVFNVELDPFLTTDKQWEEGRVYFRGQRVLDSADSNTNNVYRLTNNAPVDGFPSPFYDPDSDAPVYDDDTNNDIYDEMGEDTSSLSPFRWLERFGDDDSVPNIWEVLTPDNAPNDNLPRDRDKVVELVQLSLENDEIFNRYWAVDRTQADPGSGRPNPFLTIRARGISGRTFTGPDGVDYIFPVFTAATHQWVTDVQLDPTTVGPNGSTPGTTQMAEREADPTGTPLDFAPVYTFMSSQRSYIPFDPANPTTTGMYSTDGVVDGSTQTYSISITGDFTGDQASRDRLVATELAEGLASSVRWFNMVRTDPLTNEITATSVPDGRFTLEFVSITNHPEDPDHPEDDLVLPDPVFDPTGEQLGYELRTGTNIEYPVFAVTPPSGDAQSDERGPIYIMGTSGDAAANLAHILEASTFVDADTLTTDYDQHRITNWDYDQTVRDLVTVTDPDPIPGNARTNNAHRIVSGAWTITLAAPGNIRQTTDIPNPLVFNTMETMAGVFGILSTPTYIGVLTTNTSTTSGFEFFTYRVPDRDTARDARSNIQNALELALPRLAITTIGDDATSTQWRIQPANYNDLASFVLDVRLNDSPLNAEWIYQLATNGTRIADDGTTVTENVTVNSASSTLFINPSEADDVWEVGDAGLRDGGPFKTHQYDDSGTPTMADLNLNGVTTLIFDINRPWPLDEINDNLEYPILASVELRQDDNGIFQELNKLLGADIGWSRPSVCVHSSCRC